MSSLTQAVQSKTSSGISGTRVVNVDLKFLYFREINIQIFKNQIKNSIVLTWDPLHFQNRTQLTCYLELQHLFQKQILSHH